MANPNIIPTGKVIGILKRDLRNFSGEVQKEVDGFAIVNLVDGRLPSVIIKPKNID